MIDWAALLDRKYNILQQQADTARLGVNASALLDRTRAGLLPAESRANIANTMAQAGLYGAQAANVNEETKYVGPLARANITESGARARQYNSTASSTDVDTEAARNRGLYNLPYSSITGMALPTIGDRFRFGL